MAKLSRPCMFKSPLMKNVNARLKEMSYGEVPYAAFQRTWRDVHCSQLDVYATDSCPYKRDDCVLAYMITAEKALASAEKSKVGLFRTLARKYGAERADNKPLARDTRRTDVQQDGSGSLGGDLGEGQGLHRARPRSIASLFGEEDG